jgi:hypothetical protein
MVIAVWMVASLIGIGGLQEPAPAAAPTPAPKAPQTMEVPKGMPPRATPGDYPAQGTAGKVTIAAEFMGHAVPRPEGNLSTEEFVVVETGLFGAAGEQLALSIEDFSLRIIGKKTPLARTPWELVTKSLTDPDWSPPDKPAEKPKTSFGGKGQDDSSLPTVVHIPIELQRKMMQYVKNNSLQEGDRALPQAGLLFFSYRSKTQSIHSLELIYNGPAGKATIALQP